MGVIYNCTIVWNSAELFDESDIFWGQLEKKLGKEIMKKICVEEILWRRKPSKYKILSNTFWRSGETKIVVCWKNAQLTRFECSINKFKIINILVELRTWSVLENLWGWNCDEGDKTVMNDSLMTVQCTPLATMLLATYHYALWYKRI